MSILDKWKDYFVEKTVRPSQAKVLTWLAENWDNYDNFIIEAPTGAGKSAIALTVCRTLAINNKKSYVTTTSIDLQEQYFSSYSKYGLAKLYSASNFSCTRNIPMSCKEGRILSKQTEKPCPGNSCPFDIMKGAFMSSHFGIMNLPYYVTEITHSGKLPERDLIIFDEAHNVGDCVKDFVSVEITDVNLQKYDLKTPKPNLINNVYSIDYFLKWVNKDYLPCIQKHFDRSEEKFEQCDKSDEKKMTLLLNEMNKHSDALTRITNLITDIKEDLWVAEYSSDRIKITPVSPRKYIRPKLLNKNHKKMFMSATILDKEFMIQEYDLDPKRTLFLSLDSTFPVKNRLIIPLNCGKIDRLNLTESLKPFAEVLGDILDGHQGERGIVFVSSYTQANELIKLVNNKRLITHGSSKEKVEMMTRHSFSKDSVIVSPSMHEGVDLKEDLSRFQVVVKLPFLSLGSESIRKRSELYPEWYAYRTALSLIQSTGRSIRSDTDQATTYILDGLFDWYFKKWSKFFPHYWKAAIQK